MTHAVYDRLVFVKNACKPASFNDDSPKPTGYRVSEISWAVEQADGQPYMLPDIETELTLTHSNGEDFVDELDRQRTNLFTVTQRVSWTLSRSYLQGS